MSRTKRVGLFLVGLFVVYALIGYSLSYMNLSSPGNLFARFATLSSDYEVSVPPPDFTVRQGVNPTLTLDELKWLRGLFETQQFAALNQALEEIQTAFEQDLNREWMIVEAFDIFEAPLPEYQPLLDSWVEQFPKHFAPYLARGQYLYNMGWESRGTDYASKTSNEKLRGMRDYFEVAYRDIEMALQINPRLLPAYRTLITIYNTRGGDVDENAVFEKARPLFPSSYLLYSTMLWAKLPRWGGSYPEMESLAKQAFEHVEDNPELYFLFGKIYLDQAWRYRADKNYDKAVEFYNKALAYGENAYFYQERGRAYMFMDNNDQAFADLSHSIDLHPAVVDPYRHRATIRIMSMDDPQGALEDINIAKRLAPGDTKVTEWSEWASKRVMKQGHGVFKQDLEQAIDKYALALELKSDNCDALYWRGVCQQRLKRNKGAYADFRKIIILNPRYFEAYRSLDQLLAKERAWDEITDLWDRYLVMVPDNADAYFERAGTHHHNGEKDKALADLIQACELGHEEACKVYERER